MVIMSEHKRRELRQASSKQKFFFISSLLLAAVGMWWLGINPLKRATNARHSWTLPARPKPHLTAASSLTRRLLNSQMIEHAGERIIWFTSVNKDFADTYLATYLNSFHRANSSLANHVVVVTLSEQARVSCLKIHHACPLFESGVSGRVPNSLKRSSRTGQQPAWRNMVWMSVEIRLHIVKKGFSVIYSDADVIQVNDPWKLVYQVVNLREAVAVSTNAFTNRLVDANPGVQYLRGGNESLGYLMKWFRQRDHVGSSSGNQRALTGLLAKEGWMARATKVLPCSLVASSCCLRDCCTPLWHRLETINPDDLHKELLNNKKLSWLLEAPIFHAACMGGTLEKKLLRLTKAHRALTMPLR